MLTNANGKKIKKIGDQKLKLARKRGVTFKNVLAQPFPRYWYVLFTSVERWEPCEMQK